MKTYFKFKSLCCGQHRECEPEHSARQIKCPAWEHKLIIPPTPEHKDPYRAAPNRAASRKQMPISLERQAGRNDPTKPRTPLTKTTRSQTLAAGLLLLLLLLALPAVVQAADYSYTTNNGQITITGYTGPGGAVAIPDTLDGLPVTSIGIAAFYGNSAMTSVTIPNSVTTIEGQAFFGCTGLASVTIPDSVTTIESQAFSGCTGLTSVTIPSSVTSIGGFIDWSGFYSGAFYGCSGLTSVTLQQGLTTIGVGMFSNCSGLTSVVIPSSVTSIGAGAFSGCGGLTSVTIGNSVTNIGIQAFSGCTGLTSVTIPNSVISIGWYAFSGCTGLTSVTIPNSVTSIGGYTFSGCTRLSSVTISDSVTSIEYGAFSGCTGLTSVTIGNSVTNIGIQAFCGCTGLTGLYFQGRSPSLDSPDSTFEGAGQVTVYYLPGSTGWDTTFGGRPTALWLPRIRTDAARFGVRNNAFGFDVWWAPGKIVVVEAATDLANPVWSPLQTLTLTGDSIHFSDPQWTMQPTRFYRLRTP